MPTNFKHAVGLVVLLPACATAMYDGPMKSEDQLATIVAIPTTVTRINGRPGLHERAFDCLPLGLLPRLP